MGAESLRACLRGADRYRGGAQSGHEITGLRTGRIPERRPCLLQVAREAEVPHVCVTEQPGPADAQCARTPMPALPARPTLENRSLPPPPRQDQAPATSKCSHHCKISDLEKTRNYGLAFVLQLRKLRQSSRVFRREA